LWIDSYRADPPEKRMLAELTLEHHGIELRPGTHESMQLEQEKSVPPAHMIRNRNKRDIAKYLRTRQPHMNLAEPALHPLPQYYGEARVCEWRKVAGHHAERSIGG
jgi:hypothetical protein